MSKVTLKAGHYYYDTERRLVGPMHKSVDGWQVGHKQHVGATFKPEEHKKSIGYGDDGSGFHFCPDLVAEAKNMKMTVLCDAIMRIYEQLSDGSSNPTATQYSNECWLQLKEQGFIKTYEERHNGKMVEVCHLTQFGEKFAENLLDLNSQDYLDR